jgi:flagellar protein FlbD
MIHLTRINRVPVVLNSDLIEHIEATPDTVISLINGQKIRVLESPETIVERVIEFRRASSMQAYPSIRRVPLCFGSTFENSGEERT